MSIYPYHTPIENHHFNTWVRHFHTCILGVMHPSHSQCISHYSTHSIDHHNSCLESHSFNHIIYIHVIYSISKTSHIRISIILHSSYILDTFGVTYRRPQMCITGGSILGSPSHYGRDVPPSP